MTLSVGERTSLTTDDDDVLNPQGDMPYRATERTRSKQAATRRRIVSAALDLLGDGGYAAVLVSDVASAAGVGTGTVYRYFPSKGALCAEVFRLLCDREVEVMRQGATGVGTYRMRIAQVLSTFARRALRRKHVAHALIAEPVEPEVDLERLRFRAQYTEILASLLSRAHHAGECQLQYPDAIAAFLVGGIAQILGDVQPATSEDEVIQSIRYAVERTVFGAVDEKT